MELYAHSLPGQAETTWQTLEAHQDAVARRASAFARVWGTPETAFLLGSIHDTGKRSEAFQRRLHGRAGRVDHSSAAFWYLMRDWGLEKPPKIGEFLARLLAYALLGHHGGMPDYGAEASEGTLAYRLFDGRRKDLPDWKPEGCAPLPASLGYLLELQPPMCLDEKQPIFWIRRIFARPTGRPCVLCGRGCRNWNGDLKHPCVREVFQTAAA